MAQPEPGLSLRPFVETATAKLMQSAKIPALCDLEKMVKNSEPEYISIHML